MRRAPEGSCGECSRIQAASHLRELQSVTESIGVAPGQPRMPNVMGASQKQGMWKRVESRRGVEVSRICLDHEREVQVQ